MLKKACFLNFSHSAEQKVLPVTLSCNYTCWIIRTTNHSFFPYFLHLCLSPHVNSIPPYSHYSHVDEHHPSAEAPTEKGEHGRERQSAFSSMIFKELSHQRHEAALLLHSPLAPCQSTCSHMHTHT